MRAVKCKVETMPGVGWPTKPKQHPCNSPMDACIWIQEQGWLHVMAGDCDLLKCVTAKKFVDDGYVVVGDNKKGHPVINYQKLYPKNNYFTPPSVHQIWAESAALKYLEEKGFIKKVSIEPIEIPLEYKVNAITEEKSAAPTESSEDIQTDSNS